MAKCSSVRFLISLVLEDKLKMSILPDQEFIDWLVSGPKPIHPIFIDPVLILETTEIILRLELPYMAKNLIRLEWLTFLAVAR